VLFFQYHFDARSGSMTTSSIYLLCSNQWSYQISFHEQPRASYGKGQFNDRGK